MADCVICAKKCKSNDHALQCDQCNKWSHQICCNVSDSFYNLVTTEPTTEWKCPLCAVGLTNNGRHDSENEIQLPKPTVGDNSRILLLMQRIFDQYEKIEKRLDHMQEKFDKVMLHIDNLIDSKFKNYTEEVVRPMIVSACEEVDAKLQNFTKEVVDPTVASACEKVDAKLQNFTKEVVDPTVASACEKVEKVDIKIDAVLDFNRRHDVVISGLPKDSFTANGDAAFNCAINIAKFHGVSVSKGEIDACRYLRNNKIIITFHSLWKRDLLMNHYYKNIRENKAIKIEQLFPDLSVSGRIFLSDNYSAATAKTISMARILKKNHHIKSFRMKSGVIQLFNQNGQYMVAQSSSDVQKAFPNVKFNQKRGQGLSTGLTQSS